MLRPAARFILICADPWNLGRSRMSMPRVGDQEKRQEGGEEAGRRRSNKEISLLAFAL